MFAPLLPIKVASSYGGDLPTRLARCTPDMHAAIMALVRRLPEEQAALVLSDLFRTYDMQLQAHLDWKNKKKPAFSPPPGGSLHEAGRAFDLELDQLRPLGLKGFWPIAATLGVSPIVSKPDPKLSEAWHFDCRGSHQIVYDYYQARNGNNFPSAYAAMAASAIVSIGQKVDTLGADPRTGYLQSGLIRLGARIGNMDGEIGPRCRDALAQIGLDSQQDLDALCAAVEERLQRAFPNEYFLTSVVSSPQIAGLAASDAGAHLSASLGFLDLTPSYAPPHPVAERLGDIVEKLKTASDIDQVFALQPKKLCVIDRNAGLYLDSRLQLDTDGWPDGAGRGDRWWRADTTLTLGDGSYVNSNKVPYIVLPGPETWPRQFGIDLGDYAAVLWRDRLVFAVFADRGPRNKIGEGSLELMRRLGAERVRADGTVIDSDIGPGVVMVVFPGSGKTAHRKDEATLLAKIDGEGAARFKALAGRP